MRKTDKTPEIERKRVTSGYHGGSISRLQKKKTTTATARKTAKKNVFTGCAKSSFLYFISLYFSTIGLGRQIISTKVVSFNIIHYFYTFCTIFWLNIPFVYFRAKGARARVDFPANYFLYFITRIARTPSLFLWISLYWLICCRNC